MANPFFRFKQFTIWHGKCAMKVGTDGVLLGAWAQAEQADRILDVGTGSGLIALMLAQRNPAARIDAIDIDAAAAGQAMENVSSSAFRERVRVYHSSLNLFAEKARGKYDLIVSNPPYFVRSLRSPDGQRNIARHTDSLSPDSLFSIGSCLLSDRGRIALILPSSHENGLDDLARQYRLSCVRKIYVIPAPGMKYKRILAEFAVSAIGSCQTGELLLEEARHQYSAAYKELAKDFYLNM